MKNEICFMNVKTHENGVASAFQAMISCTFVSTKIQNYPHIGVLFT